MHVAFLDRDGTLVHEPEDGLVRPDDLRVLPGVYETLKELKANGYVLVMVTNQDFTKSPQHEPFFHETQEILLGLLREQGIVFDHVFLCPHSPTDGCPCRKPRTGMVDAFLRDNEIDKARSFVAGDREANDGGLAAGIGVRYVRVSGGKFPSYEELAGAGA